MRRTLALALVLVGCRSVASQDPTPDRAPAIARAPDAARLEAQGDASVVAPVASAVPPRELPPLDWGTRPTGDGPLWPMVDGMCIHGTVYTLEKGAAVFGYGMRQGVWSRGGQTTLAPLSDAGLAPQADQGTGKALGWGSLVTVGGAWPEHLFALVDTSSRLNQGSELRVGAAGDAEWKTVSKDGSVDPNAPPTGKDRETSELRGPFALGDGSYLFQETITVTPATAGDWRKPGAWKLLLADGSIAKNPKVPGRDLAEASSVVRLGSGEMLGIAQRTSKLVRWSPAKAVDDLTLPMAKEGDREEVKAGKTHAWVRVGKGVLVYDGEKLTRVMPASILEEKDAWVVDEDDALLVARANATLLRIAPDGTSTESTLPAPGSLHAGPGELWLVAPKKGPRGSDALYRRTPKGWDPVPLPEPPFGNDTRSPLSVEEIIVRAPGDVFVNVRRIEKGLGWSQNEPYRAVYRTRRPEQVLRCQDVRHDSTGVGLWAWPPSADASCTTPVVTVLTEPGPKPAKDYPNVAAKLRGKTKEWGDTLTFVSFPGRGYLNLGIPVNDVAKAKALATHLSKSLDLRADVACGKPPASRTLTFDVAKGTFSAVAP